ncbi:MAG: lipid-A-disaccharide synthase, partial [Rhodospirillales bacterium]|nr:lipid-A-disaccharide synthase [Rhodospirillales bacterium]
ARFAGVGGENMQAEGLQSLFPIADLAVMGFVEVLPRLPLVFKRRDEVLAALEREPPDLILTIDSWGFNKLIAAGAKKRLPTIPRWHFVAPMVWAWKEGRARRMAALIDGLLTLFPHEPPYFERHGLRAVAVGHPVIEGGADKGEAAAFRARHAIGATETIVAVLPGSRPGEVDRLLPVFRAVMARLAAERKGLVTVIPTVDTVADRVAAQSVDWPMPLRLVQGGREKFDAFAAAGVALAASGTVALELAMAGLPAIIAYKVNPLTAVAARRLLKIKYVNLVNLLLDRPAVPEFLQEQCKPDILAGALGLLLDDITARDAQKAALAEAMVRLGRGGPSPSRRAAQVLLDAITERKAPP